jgi:hypothetical protein
MPDACILSLRSGWSGGFGGFFLEDELYVTKYFDISLA